MSDQKSLSADMLFKVLLPLNILIVLIKTTKTPDHSSCNYMINHKFHSILSPRLQNSRRNVWLDNFPSVPDEQAVRRQFDVSFLIRCTNLALTFRKHNVSFLFKQTTSSFIMTAHLKLKFSILQLYSLMSMHVLAGLEA